MSGSHATFFPIRGSNYSQPNTRGRFPLPPRNTERQDLVEARRYSPGRPHYMYAIQGTRQQNLIAEVAEKGELIQILFPALLSSLRETPRQNSSVTYPGRVLIMMTE